MGGEPARHGLWVPIKFFLGLGGDYTQCNLELSVHPHMPVQMYLTIKSAPPMFREASKMQVAHAEMLFQSTDSILLIKAPTVFDKGKCLCNLK